MRARRSVLAVPGSDPHKLEKAKGFSTDAVFLDLEDAVAPADKSRARGNVVDALTSGGWGDRVLTVRVNDLSTKHTYRDVIEVVEGAGRHVDAIVLPKVQGPEQVVWLDLLLTQIEQTMGYEVGRIEIEAQVESAAGLVWASDIAGASDRVASLVFGPGDFAADLGLASPFVGAEPFPGAFDSVLLGIRAAASAAGVMAVDGPWQRVADLDGFRARATRSAALGFDGTWVLHPSQVAVAHEAFTPTREAFDRAREVVAAVAEGRGVAMLGDVMVDEASRKLAARTVARGEAAGLGDQAHAPEVATGQ
ncbi:MAG: citrate lyase subunit beta / citryl-CoA lyase [Frankiales bacterium]|nr:citrate lyase subunit beta / citryl-CoA lyase [Frankiales bacterium]